MQFAIDTPLISYSNKNYRRIATEFINVNNYELTFSSQEYYPTQTLIDGTIITHPGWTTGFAVTTECEAPFSCDKFADKTYTFIVNMFDCVETTDDCFDPTHKLQIFANVSYKYCPKHYIATVIIENEPSNTLILTQNNNTISSLNITNGKVSVTLNSTKKLFVWDVGLFTAGGRLNYVSGGVDVFTEDAAGITTETTCSGEPYVGSFKFDPLYVDHWCRETWGNMCYMNIKYFTSDECPYNADNATEGKLLLVVM